MRAQPLSLCVWLASLVATTAWAATPQLEKRGSLPLEKSKGEVREALLDTSKEVLWVRDFQPTNEGVSYQALEAYSLSGKRLALLEAAEAGSFRLIDIELDGKGRLWALDYGGRVSVFQKPFEVAETHLTAAKESYPYHPGSIAIDSKRQRAYVTGCFPLGETLSHGCLELHEYRLPDFEKGKSFLETPPALGNDRLATRIGLTAVDQAHGTVYYARLAAPEVFRLSAPDWKPEPMSMGEWGFEASRYRADWAKADKVTALVATSGFVVVGVDRPTKGRSAVVFFSPDGELLGGVEPAPGRLVGYATDGSLLFANREDGRWVVSRYGIRK